MKVTILVNDRAEPGLAPAHGFSCWIETESSWVLFDTGLLPTLESHIQALAIPLEKANAIVLSHGHYDHTNGLPYVLAHNANAHVYLHPDARRTRYSIRKCVPKSIGLSPAARLALSAAKSRRIWTKVPTEVCPGIHVTGFIPRRTDFEDTGGPFFLDAAGEHPDPLSDDQALWIETVAGLVVVLGCAHAGVVNTLDHVCAVTGQSRIHAVIGGMHLATASHRRIDETVAALERRDVRSIVPCHCTGEHVAHILDERLPGRVTACSAGQTYSFPALAPPYNAEIRG